MADPIKDNKLIVALQRAIKSTFDQGDWIELAYQTDTNDYIKGHARLLRSLSWGDPDYGECVYEAVEHIIKTNRDNLGVLLETKNIKNWVKVNDKKIYNQYFKDDDATEETLEEAQKVLTSSDVFDHIRRIRSSLNDDAALAVGSTKEMIETVFKEILGIHGVEIGKDDIPALWKQVQMKLELDPKEMDSIKPGADSLKKFLGALNQIVFAIAELRNDYGTGHGKAKAPKISFPSAQLIVGGGATLAVFLITRFEQQKAGEMEPLP